MTGLHIAPERSALEECLELAAKMDLRSVHRGRSRYAHICAVCKHSSSRHLLRPGGELRAGPYDCPCGCAIAQDSPGFWMNEHDFEAWSGAFPIVPTAAWLLHQGGSR